MIILAKNADLCTACHLCEDACSNLYFKEKNESKACLRIIEQADSSKRMITCTQCGKCMDVCPVKAIKRDKRGIVRIDKKICVGCLMCIAVCPEDAMFQHNDHVEPFKCVACGICTKQCPTNAIFLQDVPDI
jgi:carbon-monoxide dehydrogenase iron sulfur subunit